ncbi:MAG: hypothetical protein AAF664_14365 [Planctomycetota bacterium]
MIDQSPEQINDPTLSDGKYVRKLVDRGNQYPGRNGISYSSGVRQTYPKHQK